MNVAALLQDSPSEERRRAPTTPSPTSHQQLPDQQQQSQQQPQTQRQSPQTQRLSPLQQRRDLANEPRGLPGPGIIPPGAVVGGSPGTGLGGSRGTSSSTGALVGGGVGSSRGGSQSSTPSSNANTNPSTSAYHFQQPAPPMSPRLLRGPSISSSNAHGSNGTSNTGHNINVRPITSPPPAHQPVPMVMPPPRPSLAGDPQAQSQSALSHTSRQLSQQHQQSQVMHSPPSASSILPSHSSSSHPHSSEVSHPLSIAYASGSANINSAGTAFQGGTGRVTPSGSAGTPGTAPNLVSRVPTNAAVSHHHLQPHHQQQQSSGFANPPSNSSTNAQQQQSRHSQHTPSYSHQHPPSQRPAAMDSRMVDRDRMPDKERDRERDILDRDSRGRPELLNREVPTMPRDARERERDREAMMRDRDFRDREMRDREVMNDRDRDRDMERRRLPSGPTGPGGTPLVGPGGAFLIDKQSAGLLPPSSSIPSMASSTSNPNIPHASSSSSRPRTPPAPASMLGGPDKRHSHSLSPISRRGPGADDVVMRDARDMRERDLRDMRDRDPRDIRDSRDRASSSAAPFSPTMATTPRQHSQLQPLGPPLQQGPSQAQSHRPANSRVVSDEVPHRHEARRSGNYDAVMGIDRDRERERERDRELELVRRERERERDRDRDLSERDLVQKREADSLWAREQESRRIEQERQALNRQRDIARDRERLPGPGVLPPFDRRAPTPTEIAQRERERERERDRERERVDRERIDRERERDRKDREWLASASSNSALNSAGAGPPPASGGRPPSSASSNYPLPPPHSSSQGGLPPPPSSGGPVPSHSNLPPPSHTPTPMSIHASPLTRTISGGPANTSHPSGLKAPLAPPNGPASSRHDSSIGRDVRDSREARDVRDPRDIGRERDARDDRGMPMPLSSANAHPYLHPGGHLPHGHHPPPHSGHAGHPGHSTHQSHPSHSHVHPGAVHPGYERDRERERDKERLMERDRERERMDRDMRDRERADRERERERDRELREREQRDRERHVVHHSSGPPSRQASLAPSQAHQAQVPSSMQHQVPPSQAGGTFVGRFHTQFVVGTGPQHSRVEVGTGDRERDHRDQVRERERVGSRVGSPVPVLGPGMGLGVDKRDSGKRSGRSSVIGAGKSINDDRERARDRELGREKGREQYQQAMMKSDGRDMPQLPRDRERDRDREYAGPPPEHMGGGMYAPPPRGMQYTTAPPGYHPQQLGAPIHPADAMLVEDHMHPGAPPHHSHPSQHMMHGGPYGAVMGAGPEFGGHPMHPRHMDRDVEMLESHGHPHDPQMMHGGQPPPHAQQPPHSRGPSGGAPRDMPMPVEEGGAWYDQMGTYPRDVRAGERERVAREREAYGDPRHPQSMHSQQQQQMQIQQQQYQQQQAAQQHQLTQQQQQIPHTQAPAPDAVADVAEPYWGEDANGDESEEWLMEADDEQRARVRVDLGTWVYPQVPFPYFFDLGSGLVGAKDREEAREKQRRIKEAQDEREREERARRDKERKEREERERLEMERLAKEEEAREQERLAKEAAEKERLAKEEEDAKAKAASVAPSAENMEEGEIDEEEEKAKATKAKEEAAKKVEAALEKEREREREREKQEQERAAAAVKALAEKQKHSSPTDMRPPSFIPGSSLLDSASNLDELDPLLLPPFIDRETRTTILIPAGYIPTEKPLRPRLWGGGGVDVRPRIPLRRNASSKRNLNSKRGRAGAISRRGSAMGPPNDHQVNGKPTPASLAMRRPRRVYTDDSDIFLCAIHSGWLTWSGARKARAFGRDLKIDVRVIRCAGAGPGSIFARGIGKASLINNPSPNQLPDGPIAPSIVAARQARAAAANGGSDPETVREEMVGRFVGGYGERCFNPLGRAGCIAGEDSIEGLYGLYGFNEETGEPMDGASSLLGIDGDTARMLPPFDDAEDDGRSLVSAAWGTSHDGSAIEIVGVEFVERGTAHKGPSVGRRNRAQRLREYSERRAAVLAPTRAATCALAGRKRRRDRDAWPVQSRRLPNSTVLDIIYEEEDNEVDEEEQLRLAKRAKVIHEEKKLMDVRTIVVGTGVGSDLKVGFKYVPEMLKNILFPSAASDATTSRSKRRRPREVDDVEMLDGNALALTISKPAPPQTAPARPVILETLKESYLLSPSLPADGVQPRSYEIALILEAEVVVEDEPISIMAEDAGDKDQPDVPASVNSGDQPMAPAVTDVSMEAALSAQDTTPTPETVPIVSETVSIVKSSVSLETTNNADSTSNLALAEEKPVTSPPLPSVSSVVEPALMTPPPRSISPVHSPDNDGPTSSPYAFKTRIPGGLLGLDEEEVLDDGAMSKASLPPVFAVQVLQQNMTEEMFRFTPEGVYVKDGSGATAMDTEWVIQVKDWKWVSENWRGVIERPL